MGQVCKLCCQADNFETLEQRKIYLSLIVYIYMKILGYKLHWRDHNLFYDLLHFEAFKCQFNVAMRLPEEL
jgi:hypothetical protein